VIRPALRVLQIAHTLGYGGLERQVLALSEGLRDAGHTVVMALRPGSWLADHARLKGLTWQPVRFHGLFDPRSHLSLIRTIRRSDINIVHGHSRRSASYSAISAKLSRSASIATIHSLNTWKGFAGNSRMIAVSDAVRSSLIDKGLPPARIERIYNGVERVAQTSAAEREAARHDLGLEEDSIAVAMTGRIVAHKGHDLLLRAVAALGRDRPRIHIFLAGDPAVTWAGALSELAHDLGLSSQFHMLGYRDDVIPLLRAMDIFVQPSRSEALSLSMLEAMSVGLPVIAAKTGGIPEVIRHGYNGMLFPLMTRKGWPSNWRV
jgi:glycosyltransferase involved in cell wall biosynthesis